MVTSRVGAGGDDVIWDTLKTSDDFAAEARGRGSRRGQLILHSVIRALISSCGFVLRSDTLHFNLSPLPLFGVCILNLALWATNFSPLLVRLSLPRRITIILKKSKILNYRKKFDQLFSMIHHEFLPQDHPSG